LEVKIPSYLHKDIIGGSGSRIKKVIDAFGGQDKVKVQFPPRGDSVVGSPESNIVTLKAHRRELAALKKGVVDLVNEVLGVDADDNPVTCTHKFIDQETEKVIRDNVSVPKNDISRIIGRGGDGIKDVIRKFNVDVWLSEHSEDQITVTIVARAGNEKGVKGAAEEIKGKLRVIKTVTVPAKVLANLATPGAVHDAELLSVQELIKKVRSESRGSAYAELSSSAAKGKEDSVITVRGDAKFVDAAVKTVEAGLQELVSFVCKLYPALVHLD
jgi:predicted RNA-binding protein YlqC (UPF0109 family)